MYTRILGDNMAEPEESGSNSTIHDRVAGESSNERHADPDAPHLDGDKDDDNESTLSDLSDPETDELLSISATDDDDKIRPLGLSRPWGFSENDDYDVITVHGLRDDHNTVWTIQKGDQLVGQRLFEHLSVRQLDYLYATDESARVFQEDGIKAEARNFLRLYSEYRRKLSDTEVDRPIIWVCHDIGGTIVKQVLIEAAEATLAEDYEDEATWEYMREAHRRIATLSTTIIFLGCPHQAESIETLEDELHNLICLPGPDIKNGIIGKIRNLARQVDKINLQFLDTELFSRLVSINVFHLDALDNTDSTATSSSTLMELPTASASPFSRYTVTMHTTFAALGVFPQQALSHADLVRSEWGTDEDESWVYVLKERFSSDMYPLKVNPSLIHLQTVLLSMAPPTRLPKVHMDPTVLEDRQLPFLNWLTSQEAYKAFNGMMGPCTLYLEGIPGDPKRTAMLTQHIYTKYEYEYLDHWGKNYGASAFYFEFNKHDNRYNNIRSMLISFINDMAWHNWQKSHDSPVIGTVLENLGYHHRWSLPDLFQLFTLIRQSPSITTCAIFLSCFDECVEEERTWFLTKVKEQFGHNEWNYRIVITTSGPDSSIKKFIPESQVLSMQDCPTGPRGYAAEERGLEHPELELALEDLLKKRPVLKQIESQLKEIMDECSDAPHLGHRIVQWLSHHKRGAPIESISEDIRRLRPVTPENVVRVFIESHSNEKQELANEACLWVKYAIQPLTIEALSHAIVATTLSPEDTLQDLDHKQLAQDLSRILCGVIVIENREVKFSHPSFYSAALPLGDETEDEEPPASHCHLTNACLKYLSNHEVQKKYSRFRVENHDTSFFSCPLIIPRDDLLYYAVQFWPEHYRLGNDPQRAESSPLTELACSYLTDIKTGRDWCEAYYLLSTPFTRIQRSYLNTLPIAAALGWQDIVCKLIADNKDSKWFQEDVWLAITEAARNSHADVVGRLLNEVDEVQESGLRDAIFWAASPGNGQTMTQLLNKVESPRTFPWPENILFRAASAGLEPLVSVLCGSGYDLNERNDQFRYTALQVAIFWGRYDVAKILVTSGADLTVRDTNGRTPLLLATQLGQPEMVQFLLDHGADINDKDNDNYSAVHTAIHSGEYQVLNLLLKAGADVKSSDTEGDLLPPIIFAANLNGRECIRVLLEHGADARTPSSNGPPLYICCDKVQMIETCRLLLEHGADPNESSTKRAMLLIRALGSKSKEMINLLIDHGAKLDSFDPRERLELRTPLSNAVRDCPIDVIEFLIEKGASVNYAPEGTQSPLIAAAYLGTDIEKAKLLLSKGADINCRCDNDWTALHASYDSPEFISLFLEHGADINAMTHDFGTVLMMAALWGHADTIKVLLSHENPKADLDVDFTPWRRPRSFSALFFAVENRHFDCARLILEAGASLGEFHDPKHILWQFSEPFPERKVPRLLSFMKLCLEHGTCVNYSDENKNTALHWLKQYTPVQLVKLLIDSGSKVNSLNSQGLTPLAVATKEGNVAVMRYLITRGARADIHIPHLGSLLHIACHQENVVDGKVYLEMVQMLADAGADLNAPGPLPAEETLLCGIISEKNNMTSHRSVFRYLVGHPRVNIDLSTNSGDTPIIALSRRRDMKRVRYLLRYGAVVNAADNEGRRVIHYFAADGDPDLGHKKIRYLVKAGADLYTPDNYGRTPLHLVAGAQNSTRFAREILKAAPKGFDINLRDTDGWTPLMYACRFQYANVEMLNLLVKEYGADVWPVSYDGQWSARKLANLVDPLLYENSLEILEPPEDKRERIGPDGVKQVWDPSFHTTTPVDYINTTCESCLLPSSGQWHLCRDCPDRVLFCFKCFPHRNEVHEAGHTFRLCTFFIDSEDEESEHGGQDDDESDRDDEALIGESGLSDNEETETETDDDDD
ncbi:hypothetical protein CDV31_012939 [Fusarium ambrosium]|uniref:Nephrocystin 3-like N-terminal domain-containing protein n=1 Tax=Fusarium ambrosium TaxID=131363 RepID=A0A428T6J5_9HYPO|nr:hypothetical protein CDV31_012939 [Fusarium ambrosium]